MNTLTLYDFPLSGNCYKIRLLLSMLGVDYARESVDSTSGETQTAEFKKINPRGQIPVLMDGDLVLWDSMAILVYLARRYGRDVWLPADVRIEAQVMQWLAVSENELLYGLARARVAVLFGKPFDLDQCYREARPGLDAMERRLADNDWLAGARATIADLACYPYVALAHEGRFSLSPYPAVQQWVARVEGLDGWVPMVA